MSGPNSVDPASPFFSSIAAQSSLRSGSSRAAEERKKKEKVGIKSFERLLSARSDEVEESLATSLPESLSGLPPEKVLEILLDAVHSAGDRLKERQLPDTIVAYKEAVRSFMKYVVDRSYEVSERTSGGNILKRKKFTQVQIIDQKLEQLAAGILSNQKDQLGLLGKIEEINGLLVDLLS